ncbi:type II CRISPR RNA-guided endonuclease Cas9 [Neobacillus notoginsengisoli]|uniref:CRISPR-associated endonuclease Cas9 n=1 Tax=Neobacillus notoginsengisoli TaxID=1578198 RepID=A0A417YZZ8_9BACI|nr:type II CRISPR RNA-guided endonuclease Cas9 [Neobacillus notoginsengisoli]RHW43473.1 type II CRISPR RNA-guided endonuclease Cas9 [Neobacillus notoginsengisoli]
MVEQDYRLGLDIGTNSIGWSVIGLRYDDLSGRYVKEKIIDLGVRMFDKAEIPKTGASLAEPRRIARSSRRRLNRRSQRKRDIRQLLIKHSIINQKELDHLYPLPPGSVDIWDIRIDGLERKLSHLEWVRLLIHLAQRRGYKSNRKSERKEEETGKVLSSIQTNQQLLAEYRTVGEMWVKNEKFSSSDKRRNSPNEYIFNVSREDLKQEIITLFNFQRQYLSPYATEKLQEEYLEIWEYQLPFASGNDILKRVGCCSLEPNERRIPKASFTFQYFAVLDKLNNLRIGNNAEHLTEDQRNLLLNRIFERTDYYSKKEVPKVHYSDLRKWLNLDYSFRFNGFDSASTDELKKIEKREFVNLKPYYEIKKAAALYSEKSGEFCSHEDFDTFAYVLTVYKNDKDIRAYLLNQNNIAKKVYDLDLIENLSDLSYSKFGHLSYKSLKRIIPLMEAGKSFKQSAEELGYDTTGMQKSKRSLLLPTIPDEITNPIVKRALSQSRKVVNAIIKRNGSPLSIHIELARELSKDHSERNKIKKEQDANYEKNKGAIKVLVENGVFNPTGFDIVRYKLWKEQNGQCAYSLKKIPANVFFAELRRERNSSPILDVDHILPYSQSFIDGYDNKVLVYSDENRKKGNRIPYYYLKDKPEKWTAFENYVESNKEFKGKKRNYLLKKEFSARESELFKERHLNDTRYATRFFKNFVERNLLFKEPLVPIAKKVQTINGKITAHLRSRWGLEKARKESFLHHAMDAVVIACTDQHMVTKVTEYYQLKENAKNIRKPYFPLPWEGFRDELLTRLATQPVPQKIKEALELKAPLPDYMFVSRMPKRSVTGAAHKETIMKYGGIDEKTGKTKIIKKVALKDIKFNSDGDFEMIGKESDMATYEAIKSRYLEYDKNPEAAFAQPLFKPSKTGLFNPIKKVKIQMETKSFVREVNGGVAQNGDLVRIDLFRKDNKYSIVPIYVIDTAEEDLPNRMVAARKGYHHWPELDKSFEFEFSVHPFDLIRIQSEKGDKIEDKFLYFATIDIDSNRLECKEVNIPSVRNARFGLNSIISIEKYEVGILGDLHLVKKEPRKPFQNSKGRKVVLN